MASRMKKFHNKQFLIEKRSQRNQLLYEEIEKLLDIDNSKPISSLKDDNKLNITRLERLFNNYERYKYSKQPLKNNNDSYKYLNINDIKDKNDNNLLSNQTINKKIPDNFTSNNIEMLFNKNDSSYNSFDQYLKNNKIIKNKKFNLKIKYIVGIIFLVNSIIILFLIYNTIYS